MARKNIYVKDEHEALFERAEQLAGKVGLSQTIVTALEKYVAEHEETYKTAFRIKLIIESGLFTAVTEIAGLRFAQFPAHIVASVSEDVRCVMKIHEKIIRLPNPGDLAWDDFIYDFVWNGLAGVLKYYEQEFKEAERLLPEGRDRAKKEQQRLRGLLPSITPTN